MVIAWASELAGALLVWILKVSDLRATRAVGPLRAATLLFTFPTLCQCKPRNKSSATDITSVSVFICSWDLF
jgi:hypothetical protein